MSLFPLLHPTLLRICLCLSAGEVCIRFIVRSTLNEVASKISPFSLKQNRHAVTTNCYFSSVRELLLSHHPHSSYCAQENCIASSLFNWGTQIGGEYANWSEQERVVWPFTPYCSKMASFDCKMASFDCKMASDTRLGTLLFDFAHLWSSYPRLVSFSTR